MKLEDLVPPLELCQQIPERSFDDSGLVWQKNIGLDGTTYSPCVNTRKAAVVQDIICPAPVQDELLEAFRALKCERLICSLQVSGWSIAAWYGETSDAEIAKNATTAALKLWLELEKSR